MVETKWLSFEKNRVAEMPVESVHSFASTVCTYRLLSVFVSDDSKMGKDRSYRKSMKHHKSR